MARVREGWKDGNNRGSDHKLSIFIGYWSGPSVIMVVGFRWGDHLSGLIETAEIYSVFNTFSPAPNFILNKHKQKQKEYCLRRMKKRAWCELGHKQMSTLSRCNQPFFFNLFSNDWFYNIPYCFKRKPTYPILNGTYWILLGTRNIHRYLLDGKDRASLDM